MIGTPLAHRVQLSPNVGPRRGADKVSILVLHYTGMTEGQNAVDWLCNERSQVSCHYLVDSDGSIVHMVDENLRAWHAGESSWHGENDVNSHSLGIEIQNPGHNLGYPDFPDCQMTAVEALCRDIVTRHGIHSRNVVAHSDIAPGRKIDPGEKFDWKRLFDSGVGHWVAPEAEQGGTFLQRGDQGEAVLALQSLLRMYGYGLVMDGIYGSRTQIVVEAFQRHFRPLRIDGIADHATVATIHKLLRAMPAP